MASSLAPRASAFPALPCGADSTMEKLRPVTSCHDSDSRRKCAARWGARAGGGPRVPCSRRGRVGPWARRGAHSWAGRRAQLAAPRAPGAGEEPGPAAARSQPLAFCAATLPEPSREPRRPRARPAPPAPRESVRPGCGPGRADCACGCLARKSQPPRGSLAAASPKEGGAVRAVPDRRGPVSAGQRGASGRARGGRGGGRPRTSAAAQRRAGSGSPSSVHLPPGLLGTEKWLTAHSCPLLAEERVCLSRRLVLWGETGGGLPGGRGARPPAAEIRVHGRGPCLWLGSHPPSGVLARDGTGACAPAPRHPRWAPSELVWSRPVAWGHPGWAPAARGPAIKLRWIAFEFRTFKFSSSYVSPRGRAHFGAAAPHVTRPSVPVASLAPAPQEEPQEEPSSDVLETPPQARCDPPHGSLGALPAASRFGVCQRPPQ